jgi:hypothetical protein
MSVVKRRRDAIDALEHAMRGVQTIERHRIGSRDHDPGIIGRRSDVTIEVRDDTAVEHEVTVVMRRPRRRTRRKRIR